MRLRARLPVLWQGATRIRIGTDPRWSVVLDDLTPSAVRALLAVPPGGDERAVREALRREDVGHGEVTAVLDHLAAAHLLVEAAPGEAPDAAVLALLEQHGDGAAVLTGRRRARVHVRGLGRAGAACATTLAAAGVGHLTLEDAATVTRHDIGVGGLVVRDVGTRREQAVARAVHDAAPGVRTLAGPPADLVVLVEHDVADPALHRPLVTEGIAHLSIVMREASALVGPLVRPGRTACLRCLDLHRSDADDAWPTIAAQLAVRRPAPEETALAATAGTLAAAQALAHLDGRRSALEDASLELRLPEMVPHRIAWPPHERCGCTGIPVPGGAGTAPPAGPGA